MVPLNNDPDASEADIAAQKQAYNILRDTLNQMNADGVDLTDAVRALATHLGVLIAQLPETYRLPALQASFVQTADVIAYQEKHGAAGGAVMYEGGKPN